jgi:hypothetical protein
MVTVLSVILAVAIFGCVYITTGMYLRSMAQLRELRRRSADLDALIDALEKAHDNP